MKPPAGSYLWRTINVLALLGLIGWVGYDALGTNVFGRTPWPDTMVDYHLLYEYSRDIVQTQSYPARHSYPPSAIVFHYATAQFEFPVSAAIYLASNVGATFACWWVLCRMLQLDRRRGSHLLILLGYAASSWFFTWELRSQNCNLFFLLSLLFSARFVGREQPMAAGFCLALSFSLKLFSVLVIPYLLWKRQARAFVWTIAFTAVFWMLLPGMVFGPGSLVPVYRDWFQQLAHNSSNSADLLHPILISVQNSAFWIADGDKRSAKLMVSGVWMTWLAIGAVGWKTSRSRKYPPGDAFGFLADVSLLTLGPIAVSPYLEPYHPVPYAISAMLLLCAATDGGQRPRLRLLALLFFVTGCGLSAVPTGWQVRGLWVNIILMLGTCGAVIIARLRQPPSVRQQTATVFELRMAA